MDNNKQHRDEQRRILQRAEWIAVPALKNNGTHQWKWIHKDRKKAYSRELAFIMASNDLKRKV